MAANPYRSMVLGYAQLLSSGAAIDQGARPSPRGSRVGADAPKALIFAPHPDDECIIGGLPLRLLRGLGVNVLDVAVTQGSRKERQAERWSELEAACSYLGFGLIRTAADGLEHIHLGTRERDPAAWAAAVAAIAGILDEHAPAIIFMPHDDDWNRTHIGTHHLLIDALSRLGADFSCKVVETEFWGAMATPNLMVESSIEDVSDLVAALALHVGEVARNPYHLRLPAWMIDNVRRGSELVQGQGEAAPGFTFATLYRLRRWTGTGFAEMLEHGRVVGCNDHLGALFP